MKSRFLTRWTRTTMKTRRVIDMTRGAHALTRGARRKTLGQRISTLAYWFSRYRSLSLSFHHRFTGRTECSAYVSTLCKREYRFLTAAAKRALPSSCQKRGARGPHATRILSLSLSLPFSFSHSLHSLCHRCLLDDLTPRVSSTAMLLRSYRKRGTLAWLFGFSSRNEIHRIRFSSWKVVCSRDNFMDTGRCVA